MRDYGRKGVLDESYSNQWDPDSYTRQPYMDDPLYGAKGVSTYDSMGYGDPVGSENPTDQELAMWGKRQDRRNVHPVIDRHNIERLIEQGGWKPEYKQHLYNAIKNQDMANDQYQYGGIQSDEYYDKLAKQEIINRYSGYIK